MVRKQNVGWTLVQHSGYGYGGNPGFKQALEIRSLTPAERKRVEKVGGVVCETYAGAMELEDKLNFPPEADAVWPYPKFGGTFADAVVDGLRIAIPKREVVA